MLQKIMMSLVLAQAAVAAQVDIAAGKMRFSPERLQVKAGEEIVFTNSSNFKHTVTADPALAKNPANVILPAGATAFHSGAIESGDDFRLTLTVPGLYQYVCLPHEKMGMIGQIEVVAADEFN